jgi:general secretion pathway protein F
MSAFEYQALDSNGKTLRGVLQAETIRAARAVLRERGLTPLDVDLVHTNPTTTLHAQWRLFKPRSALSTPQLATLARQLATLVDAGLPIDESLQALSEQHENPSTHAIVLHLRSRVMEGLSLASALRDFPDSFPETFSAAVAAGESSGQLNIALLKLADAVESRDALSQQIWMALAYPILLLVVALTVVTGLMVFVVPQIIGVFNHLGQKLPWITQALIALANAIRNWGLLSGFTIIAGVIAGRIALQRSSIRARIDQLLLRTPLLGNLLRTANTAHVTRTLATLVSSGVPILEAMHLASSTIQNKTMQSAFKTATARVREGGELARALAMSRLFPPVAIRLIASGEKTGRLGDMLDQTARQQTHELEKRFALLTTFLGPLVILMVGSLILLIVLAIMLPIFELNQLIH